MTRFPPQWLQAGSYSAAQDRRLISALWPNAASSGCAVTAGVGMVVNVAAGTVAVPTPNNTGTVLCTSDATETVTVTAAPNAPNNRIDLIICRPQSTDIGSGTGDTFIFDIVTGTAAATPTPPAVPAGTVALAQVYVGGGVASIVAGNITDVRPGNLAVPRGTIGHVMGPAGTITIPASFVAQTLLTLTVPVVAGRRYRVYATGFLNVGGTGNSVRNAIQVAPVDVTNVTAANGRAQIGNQPAGAANGLSGAWTYSPAATGPVTFTLSGMLDNGGTVAANGAELTVDDIGQW